MSLIPVTSRQEATKAFQALRQALAEGATGVDCTVGWPGGNEEHRVNWHPGHGFWSLLLPLHNRYWCIYGTAEPVRGRTVSITCEINPPLEGVDRRVGGIFLKDAVSNYYLAHSGKVGGGRPGISKSRFLEFYTEPLTTVTWPDGEISEVILLGRIGARNLGAKLARYLRAVDEFKAGATSGIPADVAKQNEEALQFRPEFQGKRKRYTVRDEIESECNHGEVVAALRAELKALGRNGCNTRRIDLFLVDGKKRISHIFEAKTGVSTTHLYEGIGQLMLHGANDGVTPRRVLVLPEELGEETMARLERIGVDVLRFWWEGKKVKFSSLASLLSIGIAAVLSFNLTWS